MAVYQHVDLIRQMNALEVLPGCLAVWALGQMGFAIKGSSQKVIYIDPVLTDVVAIKEPHQAQRFTRAFPPPVNAEEITNASLILCTHEHLDHTDPLTLGPIATASPDARFVVSGWAHAALDEAAISLDRRIVPTANQTFRWDALRITAIPAAHYAVEHHPERGCRYFSFIIEWNGVTLFHSGDTQLYPGYIEALRRLPKADVALVAVNGRDAYRESFGVLGNLMPSEAVWMASELDWDLLVGGHNDLFLWNALPAGSLADAVQKIHPRLKHKYLQPGELLYYVR